MIEQVETVYIYIYIYFFFYSKKKFPNSGEIPNLEKVPHIIEGRNLGTLIVATI